MDTNPRAMAPKILVVEDDPEIQELIFSQLKKENYDVEVAQSGETALDKIKVQKFSLLILDWMLPGLDGLEIARFVRSFGAEENPTAILMVTAKADPQDIIQGLENGADDYVTKPFDLSVLKARVRALLRRSTVSEIQNSKSEIMKMGDLKINKSSHKVTCCDEEVQLTLSEFKLICALGENRGRVLTRERLIGLIQGEGVAVIDRTVDTHVFGLRKKLGSCADVIETVRGIGYRVTTEV